MLTVLIHRADDVAPLAASLSALVPGAVEGVVRDVVIVEAVGDAARRVADHAGCRFESARDILSGSARIKGDWLLLMRSSERLPDDWIDIAVRHARGAHAGKGTAVRLPEPGGGIVARFLPARRGAVLVSRAEWAREAPNCTDLETLVRRLRPRSCRRS